VSGDNQHYQPAALIGGFGRPAPSGRLREARVAVRRKATGAVDSEFPKAERLAYRPGMYRLAAPPTGVDRDAVDRLWNPVENGLRDLAARLAARRLQPGDDQMLFDYAATAACGTPRSRPSRPTTRHGRAFPPCRATTCSTRACSRSATSAR